MSWPFPERPGVPRNPERDRAHWLILVSPDGDELPAVAHWEDAEWLLPYLDTPIPPETMVAKGTRYLGPCLTPDEVAAQLAAARREALEEAAKVCEEQRKRWPEWDAKIARHQPDINRSLDYGRRQGCDVCAAAIRALAVEGGGDAV